MVPTISQGGTTDTEVTAEVAKAWLDQWGLLRGGEDGIGYDLDYMYIM